jgi:hypothetical protein
MKKKMITLALARCLCPLARRRSRRAPLAGGAIGAGMGALIGNAMTRPHRHCARWGLDRNGNRVCVAFYH